MFDDLAPGVSFKLKKPFFVVQNAYEIHRGARFLDEGMYMIVDVSEPVGRPGVHNRKKRLAILGDDCVIIKIDVFEDDVHVMDFGEPK